MGKVYLITGGVRCGKSRLGLELAKKSIRPYFIATAEAGDEEMRVRIKNHQNERSEKWSTIEEKFHLDKSIEQAKSLGADLIVIDCITMWITNLLLADQNIEEFVSKLLKKLKNSEVDIVMVTNEVGFGVVPESKLGRDFRDLLGITNQKLAEASTDVKNDGFWNSGNSEIESQIGTIAFSFIVKVP